MLGYLSFFLITKQRWIIQMLYSIHLLQELDNKPLEMKCDTLNVWNTFQNTFNRLDRSKNQYH